MAKNIKLIAMVIFYTIIWTICTPGFAGANEQAGIERIFGQDRFKTMYEIALKFNSGITKNVILASGNNFPDALAGVPLAKQINAPILLVNTTPETSLDAFTYLEKHANKKGNVYILGGIIVIPDTFVTALVKLGYEPSNIHRLAGYDQYETAIKIAQEIKHDGTEFYVVSGDNFPDALSASVLAALKNNVTAEKAAYFKTKGIKVNQAIGGIPLILVPSNKPIPDSIINYLNSLPDSAIKQSFHIVGGTSVVLETSVTQLKSQVKRIDINSITRTAGQDRYDTMKLVNSDEIFDLSWKNDGAGIKIPHIYMVSGENFPDALSGAVLAARDGAPLILNNNLTPEATANLLSEIHDKNSKGVSTGVRISVLGGTGILSKLAMINAQSLINYNQSINGQDLVWTVAGTGALSYQDGKSLEAAFALPYGITAGDKGRVYVSDTQNQIIRALESDGNITTVAGITKDKDAYGNSVGGYIDGVAAQAMFNQPKGLAYSTNGDLYVADSGNGAIRIIQSSGNVKTFIKGLDFPTNLVFGTQGELYVTETLKHRIIKILPSGELSIFAGGGYEQKDGWLQGGFADGYGDAAKFNEPTGLAIGGDGSLYVADSANQRIRKVSPQGKVTTIAGSGTDLIPGTNYLAGGFQDGLANQAKFNFPNGIMVGSDQSIYVVDTYNNRIRIVTPSGEVKTYAGNGDHGKQDGLLLQAKLDGPTNICLVSDGSLIVDQKNNLIRQITLVAK